MNRRDFFKKSSYTGIVAYTYFSFGDKLNLFANNKTTNTELYDLVAIKGGEPEAMFDEAIKTLGGMKNFVKKNQKVVIKPNIGWDTIPERAANTNPKLITQIVKHCFDAGAKDVYVFDHTCDNWNKCYSNSGIEKAAKDAGAKVVPGNSESYYQEVEIKNGKSLKSTSVHELILESDVFINVPILKSHSSAELTIAMKNLMGNVWDRGFWHRNNLHQCIADYSTFRKPDLNIVDAYFVMKKNGPRGVSVDDVITLKSQIISTDIVAADSAAAKLFGKEPSDINYIKIADEMKIGIMDLSKLNIKRIIL
ncbi:MAG: DUF362 domain-containing protein [Melioribacteraceae bacterium]